ncbi:MAG TPA: chemotaxis protein CheB [Nannocystaceae bacterium]|nr:chemotaxis protein CheB [Nannocystaceae bacterium]
MRTHVERDIVVLGASGGGVEALTRLLGSLPVDLRAAVFVVLHVSPGAPPVLAKVLARATKLPVRTATDGEPIVAGTVLVAPPDRHLMLTADHVVLDGGPTQNRVRPAIDALFRSAAVCLGARVIGAVLTGSLSDGSAGLAAIKRCGGLAIVQEPADAAFPDMPRNAIDADSPDLVLPLAEIARHIAAAVGQRAAVVPTPIELQLEAAPGLRTGASVETNDRIGRRAALTCPDCGGPLWRLDGEPVRYRCQIGHAYAEEVLLAAKTEGAVQALQIAVRTLEERAHLLATMAEQDRLAARTLTGAQLMTRQAELLDAARTLRELLHAMSALDTSDRG